MDNIIVIEMYRNEDDGYGMWIGNKMSGSEIEVNGLTAEECVENVVPYLEDYFSQL